MTCDLTKIRYDSAGIEVAIEGTCEPRILFQVEQGVLLVVLPRKLLDEVAFTNLTSTKEEERLTLGATLPIEEPSHLGTFHVLLQSIDKWRAPHFYALKNVVLYM